MSVRTITRDQARQVDRRAVEEYGMSGLVLMENAGRGVADIVGRLLAFASPAADERPESRMSRESSSAAARGTTRATASSSPGIWICGATTWPCCCGPNRTS